jgi:predicted small secreted protein
VSAFTIGSFNTRRGVKVTQIWAKIIFEKFVAPGVTFYHLRVLTFKFTHKKSLQNMKKVFAILAVAGVMAACNSGSGDSAKDSTVSAIDSTKSAMKDSVSASADSTKKMIDSTAKALKDSVKK